MLSTRLDAERNLAIMRTSNSFSSSLPSSSLLDNQSDIMLTIKRLSTLEAESEQCLTELKTALAAVKTRPDITEGDSHEARQELRRHMVSGYTFSLEQLRKMADEQLRTKDIEFAKLEGKPNTAYNSSAKPSATMHYSNKSDDESEVHEAKHCGGLSG